MKNLAIAIFTLICLIPFSLRIDIMRGLNMEGAIRNTTKPFYVMEIAERIVFWGLISMLLVRPILNFQHKKKGR
ncbi:hypothetical protein AWH48_20040 [Domibacillus aminovorans]|uniref:Uncharacterized protein n=1 Tax=Domibacillus aminovorans TaxID=29332 RepID=A0A177KTA1_9BACI|nr:hypothetical protein AWH48_20040 [Domibacillus aminovorans]